MFLLDSNSAHLTFTTSQSGNEQCRNKQQSFVNPYTMTILCDLTLEVSEVKITGTSVRSVCSIYVSGDRNVSLRQTTSQSSNFSVNSQSHMALDRETNGNFAYICYKE
ncbi:unnamed protein product [Lymnaea stagnalis]|uniref:Uncharacterized protein n=1 Tax=Lymnaea stagnalis TaxID=6523 RepID=A0AAV2IL60_LYMST